MYVVTGHEFGVVGVPFFFGKFEALELKLFVRSGTWILLGVSAPSGQLRGF
jgi:hypothetical protein